MPRDEKHRPQPVGNNNGVSRALDEKSNVPCARHADAIESIIPEKVPLDAFHSVTRCKLTASHECRCSGNSRHGAGKRYSSTRRVGLFMRAAADDYERERERERCSEMSRARGGGWDVAVSRAIARNYGTFYRPQILQN